MTDDYIPYQSVLVRLSEINPDALRDLLAMAYKFVTRTAANRRTYRNAKKRRNYKCFHTLRM